MSVSMMVMINTFARKKCYFRHPCPRGFVQPQFCQRDRGAVVTHLSTPLGHSKGSCIRFKIKSGCSQCPRNFSSNMLQAGSQSRSMEDPSFLELVKTFGSDSVVSNACWSAG